MIYYNQNKGMDRPHSGVSPVPVRQRDRPGPPIRGRWTLTTEHPSGSQTLPARVRGSLFPGLVN